MNTSTREIAAPPQISSVAKLFRVTRYAPDRKEEWNAFVNTAKNATFLFERDYLEYHSDRFTDYSLMVYCDDTLAGVLPANLGSDDTVVSHEGLTYGGLVIPRDATLASVLDCFRACLQHLQENRINRLVYKRIPSFYNTLPDDDVAYALFLVDAVLCRRDCALVVNQTDRLRFRKGRKSEISKARRYGVEVVQEADFTPFWERVLVPRLAGHYGVAPVHSIEEITMLASRFPKNIKQFSAYHKGEIMAGTTIYETPTVAHAQYIAVSEEGGRMGALDYLFGWLIDERYRDKRVFDFGISNEDQGRRLNHGLLSWKEGFGGRTCGHDFYEIDTRNHPQLEIVRQGHSALSCPTGALLSTLEFLGQCL